MKAGDELKLTKTGSKDALNAMRKIEIARIGMDHHAGRLRKESECLWEFLEELLPKMDTKRFHYTYDEEKGVVRCLGTIKQVVD